MEAKNADLSSLRIDRAPRTPSDAPRRRRSGFIIAGIVVAVIAIGGYLGVRALVAPTIDVRLVAATWTSPSQSNAILTASGYVVAQRKAAVASKGSGRLVTLGVVEGDRVRRNQIIARLEDADVRAELDQARASLRVNEADLNDAQRGLIRAKTLMEKNLATQAEYDAADARLRRVSAAIELARAQVAGAEVALENTLIRAPFDGTVLTKNADVGEMVVPMAASAGSRAAVVTIADMRSLQVEADVSESNIEHITPSQPCEITLDAYPDQRYQGLVARIVPTADRAKATVLVKVGFVSYDSRVLPEMSAKVLFLRKASDPSTLTSRPLLTVPTGSVVERSDRRVVFRVVDGRASAVPVRVGATMGGLIEVVEGLQPGDRVIDRVDPSVSDGARVKVL